MNEVSRLFESLDDQEAIDEVVKAKNTRKALAAFFRAVADEVIEIVIDPSKDPDVAIDAATKGYKNLFNSLIDIHNNEIQAWIEKRGGVVVLNKKVISLVLQDALKRAITDFNVTHRGKLK